MCPSIKGFCWLRELVAPRLAWNPGRGALLSALGGSPVPHSPLQPHLNNMPVVSVLGRERADAVLYGARGLDGEASVLDLLPGGGFQREQGGGEVECVWHPGILRGGRDLAADGRHPLVPQLLVPL